MIFSTNQNKQFYVATGSDVTIPSTVGEFHLIKNEDETEVALAVFGGSSVLRSDLVKVDQIISSNCIQVEKMLAPAKKIAYTYTLDTDKEGNTLEDIVKVVVHEAYANDGNSRMALYTTKEEIAAVTGKTKDAYDNGDITRYCKLEVSDNTVTVYPKVQDWKRGLSGGEAFYDVTLEFPTAKSVESNVTENTAAKVEDGTKLNAVHLIKDLEFFCYGERGQWPKFENVYAGVGAPALATDTFTDSQSTFVEKLYIQTVSYYFVNPNGHRSVKEMQILVDSEYKFDLLKKN